MDANPAPGHRVLTWRRWTMLAAMNNLRHGEQPEDVTLPALLAILR